jgi:hypothetical protein
MFLSCSNIKSISLCQGHVSEVWPCFTLWDTFLYENHVLVSMFLYQMFVSILNWSFRSKGCFSWSFFVYIKDYSLFLGLYVCMFICFINPIHSKDIHPKIKLFVCKFLCFLSFTFNMCHIFIDSTFFMFYVLRLFLRFFHSFSCRLIGRHFTWNTFKWKC